MDKISNLIIPLIIIIVFIYAVKKKINVYDTFVEGSKESIDISLKLFPNLLAMVFGISIFVKSGLLEYLFSLMNPLLELLKIPIKILPMAIMRPISGSSSLALLNNILLENGPDSLIGFMSSLIQGSTDTTFYVLTLYFGSIGIKKIKYALWVGLLTDLIGIILAVIITNLIF